MGIVKRQSFYTTIISYMGLAIGFFNTVWLYPHILQPQQYGLTELLFALAIVATQFSSLGMNSVILRYFPYFNNPEEKHHGFLTFALAVPVAGFTVIALLGLVFQSYIVEAFQDKSELFAEYYLLLIPFTLFLILFETLAAYSRSLLKTVAPTFLRDLFIKLYRLVLILVLQAGFLNFNNFMWFFIAGYALQAILQLLYLARDKDLKLTFNWTFVKLNSFKDILTYGFFSFLGLATFFIINKIDLIMLGSMEGLSSTAIYAVAFYIGNVIEVPARSILSISLPIISEAWKEKDLKKILEVYRKSALIQLLLGGLLFLLIWLNVDALFQYLPPAYQNGRYVILYIALGRLFDMANGTNGSIIGLSKFYRLDLYFNIFLVFLAIGTNYYFIPAYGINGAAMATAISIILYNILKFFFVWKKFSLQPFNGNTLKAVFIISFIYGLGFLFPTIDNRFLSIAVTSPIIIILFLGLVYFLRVSEDINEMYRKIYYRIKP